MFKVALVVFYVCRKEDTTNTPDKLGGYLISLSWFISFLLNFFGTQIVQVGNRIKMYFLKLMWNSTYISLCTAHQKHLCLMDLQHAFYILCIIYIFKQGSSLSHITFYMVIKVFHSAFSARLLISHTSSIRYYCLLQTHHYRK